MQTYKSDTLKGEFFSRSIVVCSSLTSVSSQIESLHDTLQCALDQVKLQTNFNSFTFTGGPCAAGTGGYRVFQYVCCLACALDAYSFVARVMTGQTIRGGQTFEEFLGPFFSALKSKFLEWLNLSYSPCLFVIRI